MPILAFGEYTARPKVSDPEIQSAAMTTFTYYPLCLPFLLFSLAVLAGLVRPIRHARDYSAGRYAVLVPGIAGIVLAHCGVGGQMGKVILVLGMVIQTPAAIFVGWRVLRARRTIRAVLLAPVVSTAVVAGNLLLSGDLIQAGDEAIPSVLIGGLILAWPLMAFRLVCRQRVSWPRIVVSLLVGLFPIVALFIVLSITQGGPGLGDMLPALGIVMVPGAIAAGFSRWNGWARDVVTGNPVAFASRSENSTPASGQAPAPG